LAKLFSDDFFSLNHSNYPNAYFGLGLVYLQKGDIEAARTNLQQAQQLSIAQGNMALAQTVANFLQQLP
jgi:Flp pilus assembly protein TadD